MGADSRVRAVVVLTAATAAIALAGCAQAPAAEERVRDAILAEVAAVADADVGSAFSGQPDWPTVVLDLYLPVVDEQAVVDAVDGSARAAWREWYREPGYVSIAIFAGESAPSEEEPASGSGLELTEFAAALEPIDFSSSNTVLRLDREQLVQRFGERQD